MMPLLPETSFLHAIVGDVAFPMHNNTVLLQGEQGPVVLYYLDFQGLGMAPLTRFAERGPAQHGDTDLGFRLDPRAVAFVFGVHGTSWGDLEQARALLLSRFPPGRQVIWRWTQANGVVRQLDTVFNGGLTPDASDRDTGTWFLRVAMTFKAPDPTFYDPSEVVNTFALPETGGAFTIPLPIPFGIGGSSLDEAIAVSYGGTWPTFPVIRVLGPIESPAVFNDTTGEQLRLPGLAVPSGDWIEFDLRYGTKTVRDQAGANRLAALSDDSDLATWHLEPGINALRVTGGNVTLATEVQVRYHRRYVGI
jgi:hypothetical protein